MVHLSYMGGLRVQCWMFVHRRCCFLLTEGSGSLHLTFNPAAGSPAKGQQPTCQGVLGPVVRRSSASPGAPAVCCRRFAERCCCRGSTRAGDERSSVPQQRLSRSNACVQSWRAVPFFSLLFLCSLVLRAATSACSEGRSGVSSPVTAPSPPVPTGRSLTCSNTCTETWKQLLFSLSALFHESMVCSSSSSAGSGSNGFICTKHSRSGAPARSPQRSSSVRSAPHCIFGPRRAL